VVLPGAGAGRAAAAAFQRNDAEVGAAGGRTSNIERPTLNIEGKSACPAEVFQRWMENGGGLRQLPADF